MLFEAIAAGLPIIASAVGGIPGFLEESGSGLLVRPRQPSDIVQAVLRLMRSNSFYCRLQKMLGPKPAITHWNPSASGC